MTKDARKEKAKDEQDLYRDIPKYPKKKLRLSLPLPPSVNHMYFNMRGGGKRLTPRAQNYIRDSRALINLAVEEQRWISHSKATWLYADLVFFMPDRRIRDSHNMLKLLFDVMQGCVFGNDYYVMPRIHSVEYDEANPRVEVVITPQTMMERDRGLKTIGLI